MPQADALAADLALLEGKAREAGEIARRFHRGDYARWNKEGDAGPVTEADIAIDRMLRRDLTAARPDHGWLSEETEDDPARLETSRQFIVDPIDGTRAFMRGEDGFCHALSIVENGEVVAACAYFPIRDEMYSATLGGGATLNGAPIRVGDRTEIEGARALSGKIQMNPRKWPGGPPPVRREFLNSLVFRHCLVASGVYDLSFTLRSAWEWDVAAGELIAAEAGALVTTTTGARWRYNAARPRMPGVVVGPAALHGDVVERLKPVGGNGKEETT